jgi:hypothetical protein
MCNFMRLLFVLVILSLNYSLFAQRDSSIYHFKEICWTLQLPSDFKITDSATQSNNIEKGKEIIESSSDIKVNTNKMIPLISASKGPTSLFTANLSGSSAITKNNRDKADSVSKSIFFNSFISKMQNAKIDSTSTLIFLDGVGFKKFTANCTIKERFTLHVNYLSSFLNNYYVAISYFYLTDSTGEEIETMLKNSKFDH